MWIFDFFKKNEPAKISWTSLGSILVNEQVNLDVYYSFYRTNPFVKAVINELMKSVGKYGYQTFIWQKEQTTQEYSYLFLYQFWTERAFFQKVIRDYFIASNTYIYIVKDEKWQIKGLQCLDPRYIKPIANDTGEVLWYVQNLSWIRVFLKDEVFHLKYDADLENEIVGLPRLTSLYYDLESDKEARESNLAFFKNNQTPASLVVTERTLGNEELKEIKNIFMWGQFQWGKNKHRWWIISWIKEIIKVQDKIDDAQFMNLRKFTLELVCAVYWVSKVFLNFTEWVNYSNSETQYLKTLEDTIIPEEKAIWDFFSKILSFIYKKDIRFEFIKDHLTILKIKSDIALKLTNGGLITPDEWREIIQYEAIGSEESSNLRITKIEKIIDGGDK